MVIVQLIKALLMETNRYRVCVCVRVGFFISITFASPLRFVLIDESCWIRDSQLK